MTRFMLFFALTLLISFDSSIETRGYVLYFSLLTVHSAFIVIIFNFTCIVDWFLKKYFNNYWKKWCMRNMITLFFNVGFCT